MQNHHNPQASQLFRQNCVTFSCACPVSCKNEETRNNRAPHEAPIIGGRKKEFAFSTVFDRNFIIYEALHPPSYFISIFSRTHHKQNHPPKSNTLTPSHHHRKNTPNPSSKCIYPLSFPFSLFSSQPPPQSKPNAGRDAETPPLVEIVAEACPLGSVPTAPIIDSVTALGPCAAVPKGGDAASLLVNPVGGLIRLGFVQGDLIFNVVYLKDWKGMMSCLFSFFCFSFFSFFHHCGLLITVIIEGGSERYENKIKNGKRELH